MTRVFPLKSWCSVVLLVYLRVTIFDLIEIVWNCMVHICMILSSGEWREQEKERTWGIHIPSILPFSKMEPRSYELSFPTIIYIYINSICNLRREYNPGFHERWGLGGSENLGVWMDNKYLCISWSFPRNIWSTWCRIFHVLAKPKLSRQSRRLLLGLSMS